MTTKKPRLEMRDEPQPDPSALARIEAAEDHALGMREETVQEFDARLRAWRADPSLPEPSEDDLVEDRTLYFGGMVSDDPVEPLTEYAEWLALMLPGYLHGYSPSRTPDDATPPRYDRREIRAAQTEKREPRLSAAYVKCLRRRVKMGMALHRPEDRPRMLPGPNDT